MIHLEFLLVVTHFLCTESTIPQLSENSNSNLKKANQIGFFRFYCLLTNYSATTPLSAVSSIFSRAIPLPEAEP